MLTTWLDMAIVSIWEGFGSSVVLAATCGGQCCTLVATENACGPVVLGLSFHPLQCVYCKNVPGLLKSDFVSRVSFFGPWTFHCSFLSSSLSLFRWNVSFFFMSICTSHLRLGIPHELLVPHRQALKELPHLRLGKGFDTGLLCGKN